MLAGVSVPYYIRLERGDMNGVSGSVLDALARALQLDEAEHAHLFDLARSAAPAAARPRRRQTKTTCPPRSPVDARRHHRRRSLRGRHSPRHPGRQRARTCALLGDVRRSRPPVNNARFVFLDPRAEDVLRRMGARRQRLRRHPALGRGPRPARPRPLRPRRRARNPQRRVPHPLGRPRRPLPQRRRQALPPPRRRRAQPKLQPARARRRPRAGTLHLRCRARLSFRGGAEAPRQLGGDDRLRRIRTHDRPELSSSRRYTTRQSRPKLNAASTVALGFIASNWVTTMRSLLAAGPPDSEGRSPAYLPLL